MKKKSKFISFHILNAKHILFVITSSLFLVIIALSFNLFISVNLNTPIIEGLIYTGLNTYHAQNETDFTKTVLSFAIPNLSFSSQTKTSTAEPLSLSTAPTDSAQISLPDDNLQSITYKSAEELGYTSIEGIYVNNQTKKSFDLSSLLNKKLDFSLSDAPSVLIVHTHTTESYTPSQKYNYTPTETDRTLDLNFNMASVGEVIASYLNNHGINTVHDKTINDYPSYSQSYSKSLKLIKSYMSQYPSIKIVIDVHRDAIVTPSGTKMRPLTSSTNPCAQVMMVIGTNDSGLEHSNWQTNLSFALKLQHKMNSLHPSLARPVNLRRERFNQHLAPYSFILEVGTNGNTLEEAKEGAQLFAESLVSLLKN